MTPSVDHSIRSALEQIVATTPPLGPTPSTGDVELEQEPSPRSSRRRPGIAMAAAAACIIAALGFAALGTTDEPGPAATGDEPADTAPTPFRDGVELVVYMTAGSSDTSIETARETLESIDTLADVRYLDVAESLEEAERLLRDDPASLALLTPANVPTAFYVVPLDGVTMSEMQAVAEVIRQLPEVAAVRVDERGAPIIPIDRSAAEPSSANSTPDGTWTVTTPP